MKRLDINSLHETFLCFKKDNRCKKDIVFLSYLRYRFHKPSWLSTLTFRFFRNFYGIICLVFHFFRNFALEKQNAF